MRYIDSWEHLVVRQLIPGPTLYVISLRSLLTPPKTLSSLSALRNTSWRDGCYWGVSTAPPAGWGQLRHRTSAWGGVTPNLVWPNLHRTVGRWCSQDLFASMQSSSGGGSSLQTAQPLSLVRAKREKDLLLECNKLLSVCTVPGVWTC